MSLSHVSVTLDCADAVRLGTFWSQALGRPLADDGQPYFAMIPPGTAGEPSWMFVAVPEPKVAKNRVHIDFSSDARQADVARLIELGATKVGDYEKWGVSWTTLRDIEGNEFCVSDPHDGR